MNGMEPNGVGPMSVDDQAKQSSDQEAWERVYFSRNGDIKQNNLSTPQLVVKKSPSLTPSDEDEDCEEEGQDTPLPGSTADLDIVTWPMDDDSQYQVHVTVIPTDDERRRSRYSTYHQNHIHLIPRPENHLCLAIVAMFCCCFPFGVVGIICALQVDRAYDDGNREGAVWRSKNARYCSLTAVVFGMMGIVGASFYLIFYHLVPALS